MIIHLAFYAGWPRAMSAITVAKNVFADQPTPTATARSPTNRRKR